MHISEMNGFISGDMHFLCKNRLGTGINNPYSVSD